MCTVVLVRLDYNLFDVICETGKAMCRPYFVQGGLLFTTLIRLYRIHFSANTWLALFVCTPSFAWREL